MEPKPYFKFIVHRKTVARGYFFNSFSTLYSSLTFNNQVNLLFSKTGGPLFKNIHLIKAAGNMSLNISRSF